MAPTMITRSHQAILPFRLHRPATVEEALGTAATPDGRIAYMAGGLDLVAAMRAGERVTDVVFLPGIAALRRIVRADGVLRIGACVTHHQFESDPLVAATLPEAAAIWRELGNVRVRLAGTLGGNLRAGRPHYDVAPILLALGATQVFAGDLLTAIEVPLARERRLAFDRSLKPFVSVAVAVERTATGERAGRVAVGCAHPRAVVQPLALAGTDDLAAVAEAAAQALPEPVTDAVASGGYRRRMIGVLLRRLLRRVTGAR